MRAISILTLAFLAASCETAPPSGGDCVEFDYHTKRGAMPVNCRMIYCKRGTDLDNGGSGLAALWCDGAEEKR